MFVFPEDLNNITKERLNVKNVPEDYLINTEQMKKRCTDIRFKSDKVMAFKVDDKTNIVCKLTDDEVGWIEAGMIEVREVAAHHATNRKNTKQQPIQQSLFG